MVKEDELAFNRHVGGEYVCDGSDNPARLEVAAAVIVAAYDQHTWMGSTRVDDKIVKLLEVIVIRGQERPMGINRMHKLDRIRMSDQSNIRRDFDVMASALQ